MDTLRRSLKQFQELFGGMAPSQRLTLVVVPFLVLGALAFVMYVGVGPSEEPLLAGKSFSAEELRNAEEALRQAGLTQFRSEGQKIIVPKSDAIHYNAALVANKGLPAQFGAELERMHEKSGMFASASQRQELLELAKQKELSKWIRSIPDLEDAGVIWERSKARPFSGESKVTATVSVRPRAGRELSSDLAQSLRLAVAGAVAELSPNNVTVFNTLTGVAIQNPDPSDPFNSQFIGQVARHRESYRREIAQALSYIPNVLVAVNVDLDNLKTSWEQQRTFGDKTLPRKSVEQEDNETSTEGKPGNEPGVNSNQPRNLKQSTAPESSRTKVKKLNTADNFPISEKIADKTFVGLLPKSVQVTVSIPNDYYRAVALKQGESEADKTAFQKKVQQIEIDTKKAVLQNVAKLIPAGAPSPESAVSVSSFTNLDSSRQAAATPLSAEIAEALIRWGGPVGLGLFALWALWMLNRSLQKLPRDESPAGSAAATPSPDAETSEEEEAAPREPTKRDQLQNLVRDNPEMAAAVINRWLAPVK